MHSETLLSLFIPVRPTLLRIHLWVKSNKRQLVLRTHLNVRKYTYFLSCDAFSKRAGLREAIWSGTRSPERDELVSSLDRNSEDSHESAALASTTDTSGYPDKLPVLAQHAESAA